MIAGRNKMIAERIKVKLEKEAARAIMQQELLDNDVLHSCLNCEYWIEKDDKCERYNLTPPPKIIVFSCGEGWTYRIPF